MKQRVSYKLLTGLALGFLFTLCANRSFGAVTLLYDDFESYAVTNNAPNPLTNGPAGGQWVYVDPVPPMAIGEHQIFNSSGNLGSGLSSRVWGSATNGAHLSNAISLAGLPAVPTKTFRLSFVVSADTATANRTITFNYAVSSTAGSLTFVSGHNLDDSQTFGSLSGSGLASSTAKGKSPDRRFEFVFQSSDVTSADKILFDITRVTNNAGAQLTLFLDDVRLTVDDSNGPTVQTVRGGESMQNVRVGFSEPVDPASATNPANYSFGSNTLTVLGAALVDATTVDVLTSEQETNSTHTLQISGVQGQTGISMTATQLDFASVNLAISTVRYDAGTTTTSPSGPLDPTLDAAGNWVTVSNANAGMTFGPVVDDLGSGLNAWRVTDLNSLKTGGVISYTIPVDQASDNLALTNGWRLLGKLRLTDSFGSVAGDFVIIYGDALSNIRYGILLGVDANDNLFATVLGSLTYTLTTDGSAHDYHTHVISYDPITRTASYYFDGQLIAANLTGQAGTGNNGVIFGSGSSTGTGEVNYNLVQLDVVGATKPVVTLNPQSGSYGVGQKVTFTAGFSPWVNSLQWLSNGVAIDGATSTNYTTGFISSEYNGAQYSCRALSALGNVDTDPAILTVTDDTTPPSIVKAQGSLLHDRVRITFSEPVVESYATNIANYSWVNSEVANITAQMVDPITVELRAGPFVTGSNYVVRVSNLRDTSNLSITPASPASFIFPTLTSLARYNAGDITNAPSGPLDPTTPGGGNWILTYTTDPDVTTAPIVNDNGSRLNAWQVRDASAVTGHFASYTQLLSTNLQDSARQSGWVLTIRSRMAEALNLSVDQFAFFEDYNLNRFGLSFNLDVDNNFVSGIAITTGYTNYVVTADGSGMEYHLHQLVYDPVSNTGSYYFDSRLIIAGFPVATPANSTAGLVWGAVSSAGEASMNYNLVDFSVADAATTTVSINGDNAEVSYRGILESASALGNPTVWTSVATNLTSETAVYSEPLSNQKFFRARLP